jgi:hypothetical protein
MSHIAANGTAVGSLLLGTQFTRSLMHRIDSSPLPFLLALCSFAGSPFAQTAPVLAATAGAAFVAPQADGTVHGGGPDYRVRFDRGSVGFTPALGAAVDRDWPVRFTFTSVRRGAEAVFVGPTATPPVAAGAQVRYAHTPTLTEVYDLRDAGVEQSFVFAERPAGQGDLVVRGTIATELPLAAISDAGVRYELPALGGVSFGAVTGVDHNGATVRGSIRAGGDWVEWVLPAAFVDGAAYPMVLDPLIGSSFSIASTSGTDDVQPSVAYDASSGRYLVVWNVVLPQGAAELRGQFVSSAGALLGSSFLLDPDGRADFRPLVVNVNASNRFLVAFRSRLVTAGGSIFFPWYVRAVTAANGALSARVLLEGQSGLDFPSSDCALAGDLRSTAGGSGQQALFAIMRPATSLIGQVDGNRIVMRVIQVPTSGDPSVGAASQVLETNDPLEGVAITSHGGTAGRWLLTCATRLAPSGPTTHLVGWFLNGNGGSCSVALSLVSGTTGIGRPTVATRDGVHFAVAWQDDATLGILARSLLTTGGCPGAGINLGAIVDPTTAGLDTQPVLEFARDKYVLAWKRSFLISGVPRVFVRGLDPDGCAVCGEEWSVDNTLLGLDTPALASRWSGGDVLNDEGLVVWSNTSVRGRRIEAVGAGAVVDLGGGCGAGGTVGHQGQPVLGDGTFALTLGAPSAPVLAAIVGLSQVAVPCGPCTLVPNLDIVFAGPGPHPIPIPCDTSWLGVQFWSQWLLLAPGGCPLVPDFAVSNAQRFTIGE